METEFGAHLQHGGVFGQDIAIHTPQTFLFTTAVGSAALSSQSIIQDLDLILFTLAGCLGIGAGIFVSAHIVRTLRRLAEGTAAVQAGHFAITVPVDTNDEVGQLALAFNRMVEEIRIREKIKDAFGKFVDPRIVANLITTASGEFDRAERQVVTVFFSDIAGFTSMSEQLTASAIVNMLNHYFTAVTAPIRDNHGIVDKYMGDGRHPKPSTIGTGSCQQQVRPCPLCTESGSKFRAFVTHQPPIVS